jgi:hypothetical protein
MEKQEYDTLLANLLKRIEVAKNEIKNNEGIANDADNYKLQIKALRKLEKIYNKTLDEYTQKFSKHK